jgi:hypothetical protein
MPSAREDSTPMNYNVKLELDGFNITEIDHVNNGDTLTFTNETSRDISLSFRPEMSGFSSVTIATGKPGVIQVRGLDVECQITDTSAIRPLGDLMALKIKVGGSTEK